jgi:histone acetyltransferase
MGRWVIDILHNRAHDGGGKGKTQQLRRHARLGTPSATQNVGLGFVARDSAAKQQEQSNQITFRVIRNDQNHENLKFLLDLKNIFARQLPKMPKEYIVKLVFDRNHESMIILRNGVKVVGGICFR